MGYGSGIGLTAIGLILALAVQDRISGVDLTMVGWILAAAGIALVLLTIFQNNSKRRAMTVERTTHSDGTQTVNERESDIG